jgi:hypothetical protein
MNPALLPTPATAPCSGTAPERSATAVEVPELVAASGTARRKRPVLVLVPDELPERAT